jgi:hypothetical protein
VSPLIQHKIDLFSAGLEYNPRAGISLAHSKEALLRYRSNLDPLWPIEVGRIQENDMISEKNKAAGGVYVNVKDDLVRLFALSSTSRGIPRKQWEIPLPVADPWGYCFHPDADVIAFFKLEYVHFSWESTLSTHSHTTTATTKLRSI